MKDDQWGIGLFCVSGLPIMTPDSNPGDPGLDTAQCAINIFKKEQNLILIMEAHTAEKKPTLKI